MSLNTEEMERLRQPFPASEHKQYSAGGRTYTYITARHVMDRLDEVVGGDWSTAYLLVDQGAYAVECQLTVAGITRCDVGYPNNPEWDEHKEPEKLKAAYSDALKRAAVQFGIGRYLYEGKAGTTQQSAPARPTIIAGIATAGRVSDRSTLPTTEPQIKAIYAIGRGAQSMDASEIDARCKELFGVTPSALSRRQASEFIDMLKAEGGSAEYTSVASVPAIESNRTRTGSLPTGQPQPITSEQVLEIQQYEKALGQHPGVLNSWCIKEYGRPVEQLYASEARSLLVALRQKAAQLVQAAADDDI